MDSPSPTRSQDAATPVSLAIDGMTCASCVRRVERALQAVPGVSAANVNLATERADIAFAGPADVPAAIAAIHKAGYAVAEESLELSIVGMTCASCVGRVERALGKVPGVLAASVNLASERAQVRVVRGVAAGDLIRAIERAGYEARIDSGARNTGDDDETRRAAERAALKRSLGWAAVFALPVFLLEMG
ncbi:MAG TPA: copper ion binding protein, partial [Pseudomonas sp.]